MFRIQTVKFFSKNYRTVIWKVPQLYFLKAVHPVNGYFSSEQSVKYISSYGNNFPKKREKKNKFHNRSEEDKWNHDEQLKASMLENHAENDTFGVLGEGSDHESDSNVKQRISSSSANILSMKAGNKNYAESNFNEARLRGNVASSSLTDSAENDWSETFGTLAVEDGHASLNDHSFSTSLTTADDEDYIDSEDEAPFRRLAPYRRHTPVYYGRMIEKLAQQGKIYEAIQVLETTMLKEDRVRPTEYVFTVLIGCLGRVGYTKKAFSLYNKMKKFGIYPTMPCYTALFNACSNSPWREDGLERARNMRNFMLQKEIQPNATNYAAMIKAFGMCGDLLTAFSLVDEMSLSFKPTEQTFAALLVACISDKEAGLKHAIEVWRRMRKRKIPFETKHYNLLLKAVRECGLGDAKFANKLIGSHGTGESNNNNLVQPEEKEVPKDSPHIPWWKYDYDKLPSRSVIKNTGVGDQRNSDTDQVKVIKDYRKSVLENNRSETLQLHDINNTLENYGDFETSEKLQSKNNKMLTKDNLYCSHNELDNVDSETTNTSLLNSNDQINEKHFVSVTNKNIPNILNPRVRDDYLISIGDVSTPLNRLGLFGGMPGILSHMQKDGAVPDIKIFMQLLEMIPDNRAVEDDIIAVIKLQKVKIDTDFVNMMIRRRNLRKDLAGAKDLLPWMATQGLIPNMMTYACLALGCGHQADGLRLLRDMEGACVEPTIEIYRTLISRSGMNFFYKIEILKSMKKHNIKPEVNFLTSMEKNLKRANEITVKRERGESVSSYYSSKYFQDGLRKFRLYYKDWLCHIDADIEPHPWQQYRKPAATDTVSNL